MKLLKTKIEKLEKMFANELSEMKDQIQTEKDCFNLLYDKVSEIENEFKND